MTEAIIFDNDGTLYRVESSFRKAVRDRFCKVISKRLGISYNDAKKLQKKLSKRYGSTGAGVVKAFGWNYAKFVKKTYLSVPLDKYVNKNIRLIKNLKNIPQKKIVVTNNPSKFAKKILSKLGIIYYFDKIYGEEHFGFELKPKKQPYKLAMRYLDNPNPKNVMMVEDSGDNLKTARQIGMQTCYVNRAGDLSRLKNGN